MTSLPVLLTSDTSPEACQKTKDVLKSFERATEVDVDSVNLDQVRHFGYVNKQAYKVWRDREDVIEQQNGGYWRMCWLYLLPNVGLSLWYMYKLNFLEWFVPFAVAFFLEPFIFGSTHVTFHMCMLQGYQANSINLTWAYFHHYTDTKLYALNPYRFTMLCMDCDPLVITASLMYCEPMFAFWLVTLFEFDLLQVHTWYHTRRSAFNKLNIFSEDFATNRIFGWMLSIMETLKLADYDGHNAHHVCLANTQEDTKEWIDFFSWGTHWLADRYCDLSYAMYQKLFLEAKRGTALSVPLNDLFHIHDTRELSGGFGHGAMDLVDDYKEPQAQQAALMRKLRLDPKFEERWAPMLQLVAQKDRLVAQGKNLYDKKVYIGHLAEIGLVHGVSAAKLRRDFPTYQDMERVFLKNKGLVGQGGQSTSGNTKMHADIDCVDYNFMLAEKWRNWTRFIYTFGSWTLFSLIGGGILHLLGYGTVWYDNADKLYYLYAPAIVALRVLYQRLNEPTHYYNMDSRRPYVLPKSMESEGLKLPAGYKPKYD